MASCSNGTENYTQYSIITYVAKEFKEKNNVAEFMI